MMKKGEFKVKGSSSKLRYIPNAAAQKSSEGGAGEILSTVGAG